MKKIKSKEKTSQQSAIQYLGIEDSMEGLVDSIEYVCIFKIGKIGDNLTSGTNRGCKGHILASSTLQ